MYCFIRLLINKEDCKLIAVHKARYYKRTDGLSLGPGPFVEALEYASGKTATVVGKPQLEFFQSVLQEFSCSAEQTVMIGDVSISISNWYMMTISCLQNMATVYSKNVFYCNYSIA